MLTILDLRFRGTRNKMVINVVMESRGEEDYKVDFILLNGTPAFHGNILWS